MREGDTRTHHGHQGYHLVDIEQLQTAQQSELGVDHDQGITANGDHIRQVLSAAVLADDVVLLSSSIKSLEILAPLIQVSSKTGVEQD